MLDKAARLTFAMIALEILLRPAKAEQPIGNGAVAFPAQLGIERAQRKDMPLAKLNRQLAGR